MTRVLCAIFLLAFAVPAAAQDATNRKGQAGLHRPEVPGVSLRRPALATRRVRWTTWARG